jgi:hypothetical protein
LEQLSATPPEISQFLDPRLLSVPNAVFQDTPGKAFQIYEWIRMYAVRKIRPQDTGKMNEFLRLEEQFLELYERTQAKAKKLKAEGKDPNERLFYFATRTPGSLGHAFSRARSRSY